MSYAIGYFIYGINMRNAPSRLEDEIQDLIGVELLETRYSGSGDEPCFIGVEVDQLDECSDLSWQELVKGKEKLSAARKDGSTENQEFQKLINNFLIEDISDDLRTWVTKQEPEVFLTWGSS